MFDFEQLLISEQKNPNALVLEFINSEYEDSDIIAFVEGVFDPPFYYDLISTISPNHKVRFFECGGKKSVLGVRDFMNNYDLSIKPHKVLYLCDLDFDTVLNKSHKEIFVTDFYSIESYFADASYVEYLINKFHSTAVKRAVRPRLLEVIETAMQRYTRQLIAPMALLCHISENDCEADFDKISVADLLDLKSGAGNICKTKNRLSRIISQTGSSIKRVDLCVIRGYANIMKNLEYKLWIRGKFALQLLKICVRQSALAFNSNVQAALSALCNHLGSSALAQSSAFLREVPRLRAYIEAA